ncbi:RHS repeat protein [Wenzhouxiangella sp. AB-CW3]|uniref:RHS repeat-associated core domain-containing protein n=1 Tax=Wenzhouxiangella sp. AB-CW3 TaxID=2771012 RepID=UPI00168AA69B|nr:RHS repeat-associated core domain-containing protein [Wenzhouxiangella sp. AB-CW3]QOC21580.1 RHS repeat protein [Wenzhouxiangella sp. AB-CW3]
MSCFREYDRRGRVIAQTDRWLGETGWKEQTSRTFHDERGHQKRTVDPAGRETEYSFDELGRMVSVTDALDQTTEYHYDNRDNLVGLTDANGSTHTFSFDRADRMRTEARPMGQTIQYGYDAAGQLTERTDPMGNRAEYEYDGAGRRIEVRHFHHDDLDTPERIVTFDHDEKGRLIGYDDGVMSGEYSYDALGRKSAETVNYPDFSKTHEKTWHANGRQASLTAPHGTTYNFSWDEADRLQSVVIPGEGVIAYSEYQWHQPARIEFPGGTVRENTFDGLQRHTGIRVTNESEQTLMDYAYTWDETGNITEKATEHGPYRYDYDDIDRLVEAEYPTFDPEQWTYDPLGNRITDARTGEQEWEYNDNNELLSSVEYTFEYDDNGSLIAEYHPDGTLYRSHEYNAETRLTAVRDGQGELIAEYTYDPFGRRVKKTVYDPPGANPETTWYVYSDQGLMAELDENGSQLDFYLFPPDGLWSTDPIFRRSESSYFYYQTDHLGAPQQLIDRTGNLVHSREMRAFGEVAQSGMEDRWRFPGQLESAETGFYYNYFRDYEPGTGRYVQSDPIGLLGGLNTYAYVRGNPVLYSDSLGLMTDECCDIDPVDRYDCWWVTHEFFTKVVDRRYVPPEYVSWEFCWLFLKPTADPGVPDPRTPRGRHRPGFIGLQYEWECRRERTLVRPGYWDITEEQWVKGAMMCKDLCTDEVTPHPTERRADDVPNF